MLRVCFFKKRYLYIVSRLEVIVCIGTLILTSASLLVHETSTFADMDDSIVVKEQKDELNSNADMVVTRHEKPVRDSREPYGPSGMSKQKHPRLEMSFDHGLT